MASMLTKLKQFKDLRAQAKTMQSTLSHETAHGSGAGGKVNVVMDGTLHRFGLGAQIFKLFQFGQH